MKKIICLLITGVMLITSCSQEELGDSLIDTSTPQLNPIDQWIRDNYTTPYNIEVKYRWDDSELDNSRPLTPPEVDRVIPFLESIKELWIEPYIIHGGADFVKTYIPKLIVLVGSHNYNANGSIVLGQAEGGRKITIFDLNYMEEDDDKELLSSLKTIHHEFAHILHQTVVYPVEYQELTPSYTTTWFNFSNKEALSKGFITPYSMKSPDEDFVEMASEFLLRSKADWNALIDGIQVYKLDEYGNPIFDWTTFTYVIDEEKTNKAKSLLREKQDIMINYFLQVWNIDMYNLQEEIANRLP
jgi:substrate import-associated zinc metallohydrolase lipoprotein